MESGFSVIPGTKEQQYEGLAPMIRAVIGPEKDPIANMANVAALLKAQFGWHWVGFYRVVGEELVLGPFQGPVACTRIAKGRGVCGTCWEKKETVMVDDVHSFPGHIVCSPFSLSEIVVPVMKDNEVVAVLDIDSDKRSDFTETDRVFLEKICGWLV